MTGHIAWEIIEVATGQVVDRGRREVKVTQIETMVNPPAPFPRVGPNLVATVASLIGWLVTRGAPRTVKRVRLGAGFWLVMPERPGPKRPRGFALQARRDGQDTFCWEWFDLADGSTAVKLQETGTLGLEWTTNRHGHQELTQLTFLTDVSLRLAGPGANVRHPTWRVRVLSGSVVPWPESGNGIQLVAHLPPWQGARMASPVKPAYAVRAYQPADWPAIARAHDAARLQELAPSVGVAAFLDLAATADNEGLFDDQVWVAADPEGRVVGFVAYAEAEVTWLYVHPDTQGRGAGRALLRHALAYADALGVPTVEVTVLDGGPARPLYESEGFRLVETKTGTLSGNEAFPATGHILRRTQPGRSGPGAR